MQTTKKETIYQIVNVDIGETVLVLKTENPCDGFLNLISQRDGYDVDQEGLESFIINNLKASGYEFEVLDTWENMIEDNEDIPSAVVMRV